MSSESWLGLKKIPMPTDNARYARESPNNFRVFPLKEALRKPLRKGNFFKTLKIPHASEIFKLLICDELHIDHSWRRKYNNFSALFQKAGVKLWQHQI